MTADFSDLPIIKLRPTPSDAELEAERDKAHLSDVAKFLGPDHDDWPMWGEVPW